MRFEPRILRQDGTLERAASRTPAAHTADRAVCSARSGFYLAQSPVRLAVIDCVIGPGMSAMVIVMSIVMPVGVTEPCTVASSFCGLAQAILYENFPPFSRLSLTLQS